MLALVSYLADPYSNLRAAALLRSRIVRISDAGLKQLAPGLAASLMSGWPASAESLAEDDRERLRLARDSVAMWIELADQLPPAELIDRVLAECAYAVELAGPGRQARENLKKIRGLIRRIQNRGYLTLGRLSDYFRARRRRRRVERDHRRRRRGELDDRPRREGSRVSRRVRRQYRQGSGNTRDDVRVSLPPFTGDDEEEGEPVVTVSDHELAADRDDEKDVEETKRLLYVALTRARDRLYLSGTSTDGKLQLQRGSGPRAAANSTGADGGRQHRR